MEGTEKNAAISPFMPMFEQFRAELDEHHDRRERTIKSSRDITAASKKIIFALQRVRALDAPLPNNVAKGNQQYYTTISSQFTAASRDLQGLNGYRYARQISGGCQEYLEAASFEHYITTARLLTYEEAVEKVAKLDLEGPGLTLSLEDYLLGIYDMTGELMRLAITNMRLLLVVEPSSDAMVTDAPERSATGKRNILTDMRGLRTELEAIDARGGPFAKDVGSKMRVMQSSVEKVEKALYELTVRGAERPKGWVPDDAGRSSAVEVEG